MKYEIVNEKLNIKACTIGDLTYEQVRSFLEAWNDGSSISTLTAFIEDESYALVLNKDNDKYGYYLDLCESYLVTTDEKRAAFREKTKNTPWHMTLQLMDKLIMLRRNKEVIDMLGKQKACGLEYPRQIFESIIKEYNFSDEKWHMWKAYLYGIIQGKRMERARRKAGVDHETN